MVGASELGGRVVVVDGRLMGFVDHGINEDTALELEVHHRCLSSQLPAVVDGMGEIDDLVAESFEGASLDRWPVNGQAKLREIVKSLLPVLISVPAEASEIMSVEYRSQYCPRTFPPFSTTYVLKNLQD